MDGIPISTLTPLGALCLVLAIPYLQMARGKLHPQSTIDRMEAEHRAQVERMQADHVREMADIAHDRGEWRAAHRISETARQVGQDQVKELLEHARTSAVVLTALQRAQEAEREERR